MDLGDENHILLADNIAEALMNLKVEYRNMIRPISIGIRIKHGSAIKSVFRILTRLRQSLDTP